MWPFARSPPAPDPILDRIGSGVLVQLALLEQRLDAVQHRLELGASDVSEARKLEVRVARLEHVLRLASATRDADVERLQSQIDAVRGQATGLNRGSRGPTARAQQELGARVAAAMQDPAAHAQLILDLQAAGPNGAKPSPIGDNREQ